MREMTLSLTASSTRSILLSKMTSANAICSTLCTPHDCELAEAILAVYG